MNNGVYNTLIMHNMRSTKYFYTGGSPVVKNKSANARDSRGSVTGLGRSPGVGNGNPLQYLAWKIPRTEEPGELQSMRLQSQTWLSY